jgi:hypothetical protein
LSGSRCTGAFLKGFKETNPTTTTKHMPSYAEQKLYRPTDLGWVTIHINLTRVGIKGKNGSSMHAETRQDIRLEY